MGDTGRYRRERNTFKFGEEGEEEIGDKDDAGNR